MQDTGGNKGSGKILVDKLTGKEYYESDRLVDVKNGKKINWKGQKLQSLELSKLYIKAGLKSIDMSIFKKSFRIRKCCDFLVYKSVPHIGMVLKNVNFCKVRLCPICSKRRSLKAFGQVSRVMNYITEKSDYAYIFLTLTVKNARGEDLSALLDLLYKAFDRLFKRKEIKKVVKGWFRALEVTRNWERDDYHPHFHVIIAVNKSYFREKNQYLSQKRWAELWQNSLGVDYEPIVDIRKIKPNAAASTDEPFSIRYQKAIAEVSKYTLKTTDVICNDERLKTDANRLSVETVMVLDEALHRRRLVAFGGEFRAVHKLLNLDDPVDGDLIHTDNDDNIREDVQHVLVRFCWVVGLKDFFREG